MHQGKDIRVIIPAFNEERAIGKVVSEMPAYVDEVIVVNNNSTDNTRSVAESAGATVLDELSSGYGNACLKGIAYINKQRPNTWVVAFMDGDFADYSNQLERHLHKIDEGFELVIGSRTKGKKERKSITPQQIAGNLLATKLLQWIYKVKYTDLGPFRAITLEALNKLEMEDRTYGWTVEMQIKAAKLKVPSCEVPVDYKARIGESKVSGTVRGVILAGYKILYTIVKYS